MVTLAEGKETLRLICFWVGGKLFALGMDQVQEILLISKVYPLPKAKSYAMGLIYHREGVIPLVNLRKRLGLPDFTSASKAVTIIIENEGEPLGILVDQVFKMVNIDQDKMKAAPPQAFGLKEQYLLGTGEIEGQTVLWLKLNALIHSSEKIVLSP